MFRLVSSGNCNGILCDSAQTLGQTQFCGCFHSHRSYGNHVGEFDVSLAHPFGREIHAEPLVYIDMHRSLHTSKLFFNDFRGFCGRYNESEQYAKVREKVVGCVNYINQNGGGWTVVGWFHKGEVADVQEIDGGL